MTQSDIGYVRHWDGNHSRAESEIEGFVARGVYTLKHSGSYGTTPDEFGRDWFLERIEQICHRYGVTIQIKADSQLIELPAGTTCQTLID